MHSRKTSLIFLTAVFLSIMLGVVSLHAQAPRPTPEAMAELGRQHESAWALYQALREEAGSGERLAWDNLAPWSRIYTRGRGGMVFDPDQPADVLTSAQLTTEYRARFEETLRLSELGIEYDPLSR